MAKKLRELADLTPDSRNANRGTLRGRRALQTSLEQYGAGRSILTDKNGVVIAGNKTLETAADLDLPIRVVPTKGDRLVVVQRTDLDLLSPDTRARELAYADNRVAQLDLEWDSDMLAIDVAEQGQIDLSDLFMPEELEVLLTPEPEGEDETNSSGSGQGDRPLNTVYSYLLEFDDEPQQQSFFALLRWLLDTYANAPTIAARLDQYLMEQGH